MFLTIPLGWVIRFLFRIAVFFVLMIAISIYLVRGPIADYRAAHGLTYQPHVSQGNWEDN